MPERSNFMDSDSRSDTFQVRIVYAEMQGCTERVIWVTHRTTVQDALVQSGIYEVLAALQVDTTKLKVGIWGVLKEPNAPLRPGDRIELTRPLTCDPKQHRRNQAKAQRRA